MTIDQDFLELLIGYFRQQMEISRSKFNEKDINNVIAMLLSDNVKKASSASQSDVWDLIFDELINNDRIGSYEGGDLAILCKLMSSAPFNDDDKKTFWDAMTQRFLNQSSDLKLRDFMTICNAFKTAHTIEDASFVYHAD